jgi:hypothetical protein
MADDQVKADEARESAVEALEAIESGDTVVQDDDVGLALAEESGSDAGDPGDEAVESETEEAEAGSDAPMADDPLEGFDEDELTPALEIYSRGELAQLVRSRPAQAFKLISRLSSGRAAPEKKEKAEPDGFPSEDEIAKDFEEQFDGDTAKSMGKAVRKYLAPLHEKIKEISDSEKRRSSQAATAEFRSKVESVLRGNPDVYGDGKTKDKQEARGAVAGVARLLLDGARLNKVSLSLEDAIEAGHRYVAYTSLKASAKKEIEGQIVKRSSSRSIPPSKSKGGSPPKSSPADETIRLMHQIAGKP